ncbi:MAG: hypothetical protein PHO86_00145 [Bacilli bacterium]|nr:hypothetical protein [Bacilli bacterium]
MDFSTLERTQPQVVKLLHNSLKKDRLVGIYLFEGAKGTPKMEAAYYLASLVMCEGEEKPCGECLSCKRIRNGNHPRIFTIKQEGKGSILKSQVDELEHEFSRVSLEKGVRVFIIEDIDRATPEAANRLLKFLEETNIGTYGILTTESLQNVISTIKSRSQIVSFAKVPRNVVISEYRERGFEEEISRVLSFLTNDIDEGLTLIKENKIVQIIELVKKINRALLYGKENPELIMNDEGKFLLYEKDKKYHNIFLDLMATITNDRIYRKLGQMEEIVFTSVESDDNENIKEAFIRVEKILEYKQRIKYNVNLELMYLQMLIEIAR